MKNETHIHPKGKTTKPNRLQISHPSSNKEAAVIPLSVQKKLPAPSKEFPISNWTMPQEPQGYLRGHENDCL
jgi:hypothetical protein